MFLFISCTYVFICIYFAVETYLSPVETHCMNIDYFIPDEENQTRGFSDDAMARLRKYIKIRQILFFLLSMKNQRNSEN